MNNDTKDALTDVVENLPDMASDGGNKPEGTVVSSDGTRVTLGEEGGSNTAFSTPQRGMNQQSDKE
jgi:hypothetical protein